MFIDSHCHLNFDCFKSELPKVIQELKAAHIHQLIIPGTDAKRWPDIISLSEQYSEFYFALGIHPHFLASFQEKDLATLKCSLDSLLKSNHHKCVALGEIGLDKRIDTSMETQEKVFLAQLALAEHFKLPVILHVVKTQARMLQLLKLNKFSYGGVYHAFSGSEETANEFIKLGFKLGIGGVITYPNASKTRQAVKQLPVSSLILETDAPDMPIYQQSQKINTPINTIKIFEALCKLRDEPKEVLEQHLYLNTVSIFSINHD